MLISRLIFIYFCIACDFQGWELLRGWGMRSGAHGTDLCVHRVAKMWGRPRGVITSRPPVSFRGGQEDAGCNFLRVTTGSGLTGPGPHRVTAEQGVGLTCDTDNVLLRASGLPSSRRQRPVLKMETHTPSSSEEGNPHIFQLGSCAIYNLHIQKDGPSAAEQCSSPRRPHLGRDYLPREEDTLMSWWQAGSPRPHLNRRRHGGEGTPGVGDEGRGRGWASTRLISPLILWGSGLPVSCPVSICAGHKSPASKCSRVRFEKYMFNTLKYLCNHRLLIKGSY